MTQQFEQQGKPKKGWFLITDNGTFITDNEGLITDNGEMITDNEGCRLNEEQERQAFEEWYLAQWKGQWSFAKNKTITDVEKLRGEDGDYSEHPYTHGCWLGWQARAELQEQLNRR